MRGVAGDPIERGYRRELVTEQAAAHRNGIRGPRKMGENASIRLEFKHDTMLATL